MSAPRVALLLTGDELLRGFVQDANAAHVAAELRDDGLELVTIRIAGDSLAEISAALHDVARSDGGGVDLVITTGGLGPTHDDRTTEAVAAFTGRRVELHAAALEFVEARLRAMGRLATDEDAAMFNAGNRKQASIPAGSIVLEPAGTAPGYVVPSRDNLPVCAVLPGPPGEMRFAWQQVRASEPYRALQARAGFRHERVVRMWGVPESYAARALDEQGHTDSDACTVTLCARDGELELSIRGTNAGRVDQLTSDIAERFGDRCFAIDDERSIARIIGDRLEQTGRTLAVAESCTGGLLGATLTDIPGSSAWFRGGAIVYANQVKELLANVRHDTLTAHGAVSEAVAAELAAGIREQCVVDIGIGITGIAGPGGGSDTKPVGLVFVGVADAAGTFVRELRLHGGRAAIRQRACIAALHHLRIGITQS